MYVLLLLLYDGVVVHPVFVFLSFQELELLMCGLPVIDLQDWQRHTDYTGEFDRKGGSHKVRRVSEGINRNRKSRLGLSGRRGGQRGRGRGWAVVVYCERINSAIISAINSAINF